MSKSFYPSLATIVSIDAFPEQLQFIENGLENALQKIYFRDLQFVRSADGSHGFFNLVLVTDEFLKLDIGSTGFSIVINPGNTGEMFLPVIVNYNWPVLALINGFNLTGFSYLPEDVQNIFYKTLTFSGTETIKQAVKIFEGSDSFDDFSTFTDKINQKYNLSGGNAIGYPTNGESLDMAEDIRTEIVQNAVIVDEPLGVISQVYLEADNPSDYAENLSRYSQGLIGEPIMDYLKKVITPRIDASLELAIGLAFPRNILLPLYTVGGNVLPLPEQSTLVFEAGTLDFSTQGGIGFEEEMAVTLNHPSQIGQTGLGIDIIGVKLDLSRESNIDEANLDGRPQDFIGVFAQKVAITLPAKWFNSVDNSTLQIAGYNLLIGTGGISGTIGIEAIATGDPSPGVAYLNLKIGNWTVGFNHFAMTFKQNVITDSFIGGRLTIPKLKAEDTGDGNDTAYVEIKGHLNEAGDFNLTGSKPSGFPFKIFDIITVNILTVELGRQNDDFYIGTSAEISFDNPIMNKLLNGQKIVVPKLRIYDNGRFEIVGGSSTIPTNITLNLGPVEVSVTGINFGSHQQEHNGIMRKYNYWGFDGAISLDPLGIDARGEGLKFYYTVDNEELAQAELDLENPNIDHDVDFFRDSYLRIQTIEIDIVIPGSANPDNAKAIIHGMLSIPEPGESQEYIGEVSLELPETKITAGVAMRLQPRYPAFLLEAYLELPKPIPIGPLGIYGFSGLLGFRYVAEKEAVGLSPDDSSWYDYYTYPARGVNQPKFTGPEATSDYTSPFSLGAGALIATTVFDGYILSARVMLLLSVPSLFIVEGRADILSDRIRFDSTDEPPFYAFMAWGGGSIEMGLGADLKIPKSGSQMGKILTLNADVEARFFLHNPSMWYVNFGTQENPVDAEVITLFNAPTYLMISAQGIKGGARTEFNLDKKYGPAKVKVKAYFEIGGFVSFEKPQIGGYIAAGGVVDVDIWFIGFSIAIDALFSVEVPEPFKIYAEIHIKVCAKIAFIKKCFKFTVELNWEKNDTLDTSPISPLPDGSIENQIDRTDEAVKGVHMLTNETFPVTKFAVLVNSPDPYPSEPDPLEIDKIIPLDTYIDIKSSKGLNPTAVNSKIGGGTAPPTDYTDLIPPEQVVKGMSIRQIKHKYAITDFVLKAHNGTDWVDYHPFVAVVKADTQAELDTLRGQVAGLRIGYWQRSGQQYNALRLLATNPFSYTEAGEPGWFIPEQYGITPSTLFCEGTALVPTCCNVLNKILGTTYYPPTQMNGVNINGAYFTLELGNIGYITLNFDGTQNVVEADNTMVVSDNANSFDFAKSLKFENGNSLVIFLPEASAEVKFKFTTTANSVKIRYYKSGLTESPASDYVLLDEETYTQSQLGQEIEYLNENDDVVKIVIDPETINLDAINAITAQIDELLGGSYGNYSGSVDGLNPQDQAEYDVLLSKLDSLLGDGCGSRKRGKESRGKDPRLECVTSLQEVCWLGREAYEYNETIPGQEAINTDSLDMQAAIQNVVQPIWRPNTTYYISFRLQDLVDNGPNPTTYDYYYGFKTVGPLGHYHLNPEVDYLPEGAKADEYPLTSLRRYIDYRRSYPNADGDLLMAKPVFYANRQCKINLFFTKPLTYNMVNKWYAYNGLPNMEGALHIAIKDPVSEAIVPYPLPIEVDESIPIPASDSGWENDDDPLIPLNIAALNNQILQGNTDPDVQCTLAIGDPLVPYSQSYQVILTNLKPRKLYTALFYNAFDKNASNSLEDSESEQVHQYVFQTSRYGNFREQVESFILQEIDEEGTVLEERNAVFRVEIALTAGVINSAFSIFPGQTPDAGAEDLAVQYQHRFDRVVEGLFRITPENPPQTTEFNVIVNSNLNKIVAILIKNPEPFNNPKMSLGEVEETISVLNAGGNIDTAYHYNTLGILDHRLS